jgi:hypothetical protein
MNMYPMDMNISFLFIWSINIESKMKIMKMNHCFVTLGQPHGQLCGYLANWTNHMIAQGNLEKASWPPNHMVALGGILV